MCRNVIIIISALFLLNGCSAIQSLSYEQDTQKIETVIPNEEKEPVVEAADEPSVHVNKEIEENIEEQVPQTETPIMEEPVPTEEIAALEEPKLIQEGKVIALTFDDGPSQYTDELLNILEENNASASFFVLGQLVPEFASTIEKAHENGNEIYGHTVDHSDLTTLSDLDMKRQINTTYEEIENFVGTTPKLYRPPYGAFNENLKSVSANLGFEMVLWTLDSLDWESRNADAVYTSIMNEINPGDIILCHDIYESTVEAMKRVIPELVAQGYVFVTLTDYMEVYGHQLEPGKILLED